jgi:hypothetical protein
LSHSPVVVVRTAQSAQAERELWLTGVTLFLLVLLARLVQLVKHYMNKAEPKPKTS